ncbi:helix-hairpin-helix domain-containing protein [Caldicellulosiruptoraceae bacterium PP1]
MFMNFSLREKIFIVVIVISLIFNFVELNYIFKTNSDIEKINIESIEDNKMNIDENNENRSLPNQSQKIYVYVTGNVKKPGVYILKNGDRVFTALELAGGTLKDSDLTKINMAQKLVDEQKIYVPKINEKIDENNVIVDNNIENDNGKININTASKSDFEKLPGIGPAIAQKIIDYREKVGRFKSIDDIKNVSGIGEKKYDAIKDYIYCN